MEYLPKRVAIIYDRVNKWGGAEQVLMALNELFPQAPLFTSVFNPQTASWSKVFKKTIPSFLNKIKFITNHHEFFAWLMPLAFESLDLKDFEIIITVTSAECKGIITLPNQLHICYCLTPTRYLWSHKNEYFSTQNKLKKFFSIPLLNYLKIWDKQAKNRPDIYISISKTVQERIKNFYQTSSEIVYPPVDINKFSHKTSKNYFIWIGRLVSYKKADRVVELFNKLNLPLVIVGDGSEKQKLQKIAKKNIKFAGFVNNKKLKSLLESCSAMVSMHEEDFGITYIEAQAAGKPILGLKKGALSEIITSNLTGTLVETEEELINCIKDFKSYKFSPKACRKNAENFSKERFFKNFAKVYSQACKTYQAIYMS